MSVVAHRGLFDHNAIIQCIQWYSSTALLRLVLSLGANLIPRVINERGVATVFVHIDTYLTLHERRLDIFKRDG